MFDLELAPNDDNGALLVHLDQQQGRDQAALQEFEALVAAAGVKALQTVLGRLVMHSKYFVGPGKAEEIAAAAKTCQASVVLFNHDLSPAQARNLERLCGCRVLDRTQLILDIFAQRAQSYEGKLQVELAQLRHLATRLVRGWTHLERQKGGIGLRGPGETQLESDRRLIKIRISQLTSRLEKLQRQRHQGRRARLRAGVVTVSLVGYTNAGKSTLFNRLTQAQCYMSDQLFATLDPTLRRIKLEGVGRVLLADTVGFLRDLPHPLIAAFKTTLQESREATLLLHIIDGTDPERDEKIAAVDRVLYEIEANATPTLLVINKIDGLIDCPAKIERDIQGVPVQVWLSAQSGAGIELLLQAVSERLSTESVYYQLQLPPQAYALRCQLHRLKAVMQEQVAEDGCLQLSVQLAKVEWQRLNRKNPQLVDYIV